VRDDVVVAVDLAELDGAPPRHQRPALRSEEHTSELQSLTNLVCRLLLEKKKKKEKPSKNTKHKTTNNTTLMPRYEKKHQRSKLQSSNVRRLQRQIARS